MNPIYESLLSRKSVRVFEKRAVPDSIKEAVLNAAFQAPTAGNQMLYSIIDVTEENLKKKLSVTCDNQNFIAEAPIALIFLADSRRWLDAYEEAGLTARKPGAGDLLLSIQDAVIAAQNAVVAAESFGLGSCYIGDILENVEAVRKLLELDAYVVPVTMLVLGYPTDQQKVRKKPERFEKAYIVHENRYRRLALSDHREMFEKRAGQADFDYDEYMRKFCERKYMSEFSLEMTRSSKVYLKAFLDEPEEE
ncbi:nitroreductase family protein [Proteiniclasticum sp. SCR006]|uniref:Nitroreductase family protein n=1 Tax=Proteiniclasticum aestuarii TaxID=2817862 RepID=A0A939HAP0_9CLOT|nr:nitroreductase family protein [Proteiniclasticum aestuarii]MBO1266286.1 nitroreductase family protein [Proteiniclasticum aestuarii]